MKLQDIMDYALPVLVVALIVALCAGLGWLAFKYVTLD